jgi:hypothetical protein
MSRRRKKSAPSTIRASRDHARALAPRAPVHERVEVRAYPSAAELFAQGTAWRDYVTDTLRSLLAPAAIASAVSLAGCAGAGDSPNGVVGGDTTRIESSATLTPVGAPTVGTPQPTNGSVVVTPLPPTTLTPVGPGQLLTPPTNVTPPHGTSRRLGGAVRAVNPHPAIQPATHPPGIRGEAPPVLPSVEPPQVEGQMRQVQPIQPTLDPQPLGGAPPPVQPPTPQPVQPTSRPQPPPNPHPPAVPGGLGVMRVDTPVRSS